MKTLEHFLKFKNGKSSPARIEDGLYPVFGSNGIIGYSNQYNTSSNTIIIGRVGSYCGSIYFSKQKCWVTDNAIIVNAKSLDDDKFWYYFLKNLNLNNLKVGSGQPLLNQLILKSIPVPLELNVETRKNISNTISIFDQKIELNTQTNQTLEQIAQAIFKHWFIDFAPVHAKANALASGASPEQAELATMASLSGKTLAEITALQHTAPEAYHQLQQTARVFPSEFVESEVGLVPKGWEVKPLIDQFDFLGGSQPPKSEHIYEEKEGYIRFIQNRDYANENHKTYIPISKKNKICNETDILMDKYGEAGKVRFGISGAYNVALAKIEPKNILFKEFLRWYFMQEKTQEFLFSSSLASTRSSLNSKTFIGMNILVPTNNVLSKFNDISDNYIQHTLNLRRENRTLSEVRDLLLPKLLNGEIAL
ncbi:restriction endonuclease subunit S [Gallibacterium genomosp. 1]|uniref:Restriction endonuclease HindVIIP subunit S n=1 Tax=Gallibacterium genomosp. 1 TaxID=155515 RepID=A0A0A2XRR0_9PAST|nr:restriction endonuclease subunit S [Gallibacterium genomosp. 1]KGQ35051.1 restriction endonuclease HindVIIP subunit S [Gallibacterium genomosp. 1]